MDAKYINPFLVAIKDIFDTMIDLPVTIGKPFIKKDKIPSYEVSSIIGLSGPVIGCVAISFSKQIQSCAVPKRQMFDFPPPSASH